MGRRFPYWLRSSTKRAPRTRSATVVRRYELRPRPTVGGFQTHAPGLLSPTRTRSLIIMDPTDSPFTPPDEFPNVGNNIATGSRMRRHSEKTKAHWDFHKTRVLLTVAASLIDNGHRRGSCLSPTGYNQLLTEFNRITSQTLTTTQIKSRMVQLGKDWRAWMDMKNPNSRITGMGWNSETNTWDAPDSWWALQQQRNPQVMKFRARGLEHADLMERVFGGSTATGEWHWTPSARNPPPEDAHDSEMQGQADFVASTEQPPVADENIPSGGHQGSGSGGVRRRRGNLDEPDDDYSGSRRRRSHGSRMSESIASMADAVRGRSNTIRHVWDARQSTMNDCIVKLLAMEEVDSSSELYLFALDLFTSEVNREVFLGQPDDAHRMRWLLYQQRKGTFQRRTSSPASYPYYPPPGPDDASGGFFPTQ